METAIQRIKYIIYINGCMYVYLLYIYMASWNEVEFNKSIEKKNNNNKMRAQWSYINFTTSIRYIHIDNIRTPYSAKYAWMT